MRSRNAAVGDPRPAAQAVATLPCLDAAVVLDHLRGPLDRPIKRERIEPSGQHANHRDFFSGD